MIEEEDSEEERRLKVDQSPLRLYPFAACRNLSGMTSLASTVPGSSSGKKAAQAARAKKIRDLPDMLRSNMFGHILQSI